MINRFRLDRSTAAVRYSAAVLISAAVIGLRLALDPLLGSLHAHLGVTVAVAITALLCGSGPALLAIGITAVASFRLFVVPRPELMLGRGEWIAGLVTSIGTGCLLVWLVGALKRSQREAERQAASATSAEARLRERDAYLREFIDHTSAIVYLKDLDGRFLLVNRRYESLFPDGDPGPANQFTDSDRAVVDSGRSQTFEESLTFPHGERSYVTVKFPILDEDRRIVAVGGVSTDVTEFHLARADLERKERLLRSLIDIQEQEKQMLCGEFHDGLMQYAVGAKMMLESLPAEGLPPGCVGVVDSVVDSLARGIEDGRRVIHGIRPAELDDLGLVPALQMLVEDIRTAGVAVAATIDPAIGDVPQGFQVTVFRIVQEALSNVRRHSGSDRVTLDMQRDGAAMGVRIEDFGSGGLGGPRNTRGFGIAGMQERARLAGGECQVEFRPGEGTVVTARLPIPAGDHDPTPPRPLLLSGS